jgi:hypothetical protein
LRKNTVKIFISHTQKDVEFLNIFDSVCARVGIDAFRSELERIKLPAWQTIRDEIQKSRALFLLIGKELVKAQDSHNYSWEFTQNWIAFEIGVACDRGIDVWVVCDDELINFPVPYLNNYLTVSPRHKESFDFLVENLDMYTRGITTNFPNAKQLIECPYDDNCKAIFNFPVQVEAGEKILCPQCLREIEFYSTHMGE